MKNMSEIGARFAEMRIKMGYLRQEPFGEMLGEYANDDRKPIDRTTISKIESGKISIPEKVKRVLVSPFRINMLWLEFGQGEMWIHSGGENVGLDRRKMMGLEPLENKGLLFVPIKAQAAYALQHTNPKYLEQLERVFIPGMPYEGENFRIFEMNGDGMEPTFGEGIFVIAERVNPESFDHAAQYYVYVVVTETQMVIKRLFRMEDGNYVLISDNEEYYPQQLLKKDHIKELWFVKRKMDWSTPPPKKFEINVKSQI